MPEGEAGAAAQPSTVTPAQPATQQPSGGDFVQVSKSDFEKYQRYGEQLKGSQAYYETASKYGFKKAEDFGKLEALSKRGVSLDKLVASFAEEQEDNGGGTQPAFDPDKFSQELEGKLEKKLAIKEWEASTKGESALIDGALSDLAGEDASEYDKQLLRQALENELEKNRRLYDSKHALHNERLMPLSKEDVDKAASKFKELRAKTIGERLNEKANASVKRPAVQSPAGAGSGQGAPSKPDAGSKDAMKQRFTEIHKRNLKAAGREPMGA
jgi:uncharacterized membrane protein